MKGEWLLVRMKPRPGEKRENWLLRKIDDAYAGGSDELTGRHLTSVLTDRTMAEITDDASGEQSLKGAKGAAFEKKMKATATPNEKIARIAAPTGKPPKFKSAQSRVGQEYDNTSKYRRSADYSTKNTTKPVP